jgi:IS30 family transposase
MQGKRGNWKFDWAALDTKVAELFAEKLEIKEIAQRLGSGVQTVQRSMRRQGLNRYRKVVANA